MDFLNIDTEDDDELTIGCAGGIDINATRKVAMEPSPEDATAFELVVRGLSGDIAVWISTRVWGMPIS